MFGKRSQHIFSKTVEVFCTSCHNGDCANSVTPVMKTSQGSTLRLLNHLPTGEVPLQFDLPESKFYLPKTKITQKVTFKSFNVKLSFLCGIYYSKPGCLHISRNKNKTFIRIIIFFFFFLIFLLALSGRWLPSFTCPI